MAAEYGERGVSRSVSRERARRRSTVHLVGRDVQEALDARLAGHVAQHVGADGSWCARTAYGSLIERSTWLSAAKWTTASWPQVRRRPRPGRRCRRGRTGSGGRRRRRGCSPGCRRTSARRRRDLVVGGGEHVAHVVRADEPGGAGDEQLQRVGAPVTRRRSGSGRRPSGAAPAGGCWLRATTASRPIRLSSSRGMSRICESSITTECSISLLTISQPAPIAAERTDEAVDDARAGADRDRAADRRVDDLGARPRRRPGRRSTTPRRPCRRCAVSIFSSSSRLASSSGVSLPVSIHQPVSSSVRTRWPWSISHWMASVISSSPRADGSIAATASWIVGSNRYTPTSARSDGGSAGFSTRCDDVAVGVERGDAEAVRVGHLLQQDLGGGRLVADARPPRTRRRTRRGPARAGCRRGTSRSRRRRGSRGRSARSGRGRAARPAGCR